MEDAHQASKVLWLADDGGFPVHVRYGSRLVDGFAAETIAASRLVGLSAGECDFSASASSSRFDQSRASSGSLGGVRVSPGGGIEPKALCPDDGRIFFEIFS